MIAFCLWALWPLSGRRGWIRVQRFQFELHSERLQLDANESRE